MNPRETRRGPSNQPERYFAGVANPDLSDFLVRFDQVSVQTTPVHRHRQRVDILFWKLIEAEGWGDRNNPQAWQEIKIFGRKAHRERLIDLTTILGGQELYTANKTSAYAFAALVWGMRTAPFEEKVALGFTSERVRDKAEVSMIIQRTKAALGDHPLAAAIRNPRGSENPPEVRDFSGIEDEGCKTFIEEFRDYIKTDTRPTMSLQGFLWRQGLGEQLGISERNIKPILVAMDEKGIFSLAKSKGMGGSVTLIDKNKMYVLAAVVWTLRQHYPQRQGRVTIPAAKELPWKEIVEETTVTLGQNPLSQMLNAPQAP